MDADKEESGGRGEPEESKPSASWVHHQNLEGLSQSASHLVNYILACSGSEVQLLPEFNGGKVVDCSLAGSRGEQVAELRAAAQEPTVLWRRAGQPVGAAGGKKLFHQLIPDFSLLLNAPPSVYSSASTSTHRWCCLLQPSCRYHAHPHPSGHVRGHCHGNGVFFAQGESIEYSGDPLRDFTLIRFLDRFVFRNPKQLKGQREFSFFLFFLSLFLSFCLIHSQTPTHECFLKCISNFREDRRSGAEAVTCQHLTM